MEAGVWAVIVLLIVFVLGLLAKVFSMRKAAREIRQEFSRRLITDTNTLISISSRDSSMRSLAAEINVQLRMLRKERHRFQQGDQELKEAVTNISHDLRTPLTAICGYLELLEKEEKSETVSRYLSMIENRTETMQKLTEELFRYSVVASTKEMEHKKTDLNRVLEETLLSFYGAMRQAAVTPVIQLPDHPVWRMADPVYLGRIFSNIISNALKYSDGDLSVSLKENGTAVFSNRAVSLTPVTVGRLFDRFYTVETGRKSTGLGLSIARLLTERMGGNIRADYRDDRLYITVSFPEASSPSESGV